MVLGDLLLPNKLLLLAERRNALSTLDYALASSADDAANTRSEVEAAMKRTAEEVGLKAVFCFPAACIPVWSPSLKGCILVSVVHYAWSWTREDSCLACQGTAS